MKKDFKIRKRRDFLRVSRSGCYFRTDFFIIQAGFNDLENYRVGFTASKKVGNAVIRNRCKRRMRAAADIMFPNLGINGVDYVIIAKAKMPSIEWQILLKEIEKALAIVNGKISKCKKYS